MSSIGSRNSKSLELSTTNDSQMPQGPEDTVSSLSWSPVADYLAVSSWDNSVRVYEVNSSTGIGQGRALYNHEGPALCCCWWADGTKVISGGADNAVRAYDLQSGQSTQIGSHDQPVSGVAAVNVGQPMVATVSWDRTLKYWDLTKPEPVAIVQLPERAVSISSKQRLLVIGCANRQVVTINLENPSVIFKTIQSPLRHDTQIVSCQVDGSGYAIGGIEWRCAIQYINPPTAPANFSFKCHRVQQGTTNRPIDEVYPVTALDFHPVQNTLVTGGADGTFHVWDKDNRHRLAFTKSLGEPVTAVAFNAQGTLLAYALGYDWHKGFQFSTPNKKPTVSVHKVNEWEIRPKNRR